MSIRLALNSDARLSCMRPTNEVIFPEGQYYKQALGLPSITAKPASHAVCVPARLTSNCHHHHSSLTTHHTYRLCYMGMSPMWERPEEGL